MSMTKRDYEPIAKVFRESLDYYEKAAETFESEAGGFNAVRRLLYDLADRLEQGNPNFDRLRFLTAATGVEHGEAPYRETHPLRLPDHIEPY